MATRSCNICLEEKEIVISKYRCVAEIVCHTCQSGYVCKNCIPNVDPTGSIFLHTRIRVAKAIKCPCCRVLNWNYHYNQIVLTTLGYDPDAGEGDWQYENINRAQRVFLRNAGIVWDDGDEVIEWANTTTEEFDYQQCSACGDTEDLVVQEDPEDPRYCEDCWKIAK